MSEFRKNELLYTLCFVHLTEMRNRLQRRTTLFNKEEGKAQLEIANAIYALAAGAAVKIRMPWESSDVLVKLMQEIEDIIIWNQKQ